MKKGVLVDLQLISKRGLIVSLKNKTSLGKDLQKTGKSNFQKVSAPKSRKIFVDKLSKIPMLNSREDDKVITWSNMDPRLIGKPDLRELVRLNLWLGGHSIEKRNRLLADKKLFLRKRVLSFSSIFSLANSDKLSLLKGSQKFLLSQRFFLKKRSQFLRFSNFKRCLVVYRAFLKKKIKYNKSNFFITKRPVISKKKKKMVRNFADNGLFFLSEFFLEKFLVEKRLKLPWVKFSFRERDYKVFRFPLQNGDGECFSSVEEDLQKRQVLESFYSKLRLKLLQNSLEREGRDIKVRLRIK